MNLYKKLFASVICSTFIFNISALEVAQDELKSAAENDTIVFINYTGPHSRIDSLGSIKGIGTSLGTVINSSPTQSTQTGSSSKYSIIHAVDPNQKDKLDADIFIIGKDAGVDHINNLRHIIAAYLSSAYGYSEKDGETIATFITVYNAVYRSNLQAYKDKYKDVVTKNLSQDACGLSVNYKDWAGKSQVVIPLFDINNGGLSTVDTSVISDSQVVKHMQEDDDKNIESRKDMVDLKEREAENATDKAQEAQKQAVQEQRKLAEEKAKTEEAKKNAEEAQKEAEQKQEQAERAQQTADENPKDKDAQREAEKAQREAEEAQKEAEQAQESYEEQQKAEEEQQQRAEEAKEEAQNQQATADKKNAEAQSERKTIAQDQQAVIQKEIANLNAPSAYAIELVDEASLLSALVKVNTQTGEVIKSSPVAYIRNRTMYKSGNNFIAIAGENKGNGAIKLITLSADTMEILKETNEAVSEKSVLVQDGSEFYCIIKDGSSFKLAKYDENLTLKLKSDAELLEATPVTIADDRVIVTAKGGSVKVLNKSDLKEVSK